MRLLASHSRRQFRWINFIVPEQLQGEIKGSSVVPSSERQIRHSLVSWGDCFSKVSTSHGRSWSEVVRLKIKLFPSFLLTLLCLGLLRSNSKSTSVFSREFFIGIIRSPDRQISRTVSASRPSFTMSPFISLCPVKPCAFFGNPRTTCQI